MDERFRIESRAVRGSFARAAASYDAAAALQREVLDRLLERVDQLALRPTVVLDVGTGTGLGARRLSDRFRRARIVALDSAEPMTRRARGRRPWLRKFDAVCGDAARLPLAAASVDLVFSSLMLQWLGDPEPALREFRRVLKPGGTLLFTTFGPDTLGELRDAWSAADQRVHVNRFLDMHVIGDALLRSGYRDPVVDAERMVLTYADTMALMHDLKAIGAHNLNRGRAHGLTGRGRLAAMQAAYERHRTADGRIPATWEVVFGRALAPPPGAAVGADPAEARVSVESIPVRRR